MPSAAHIPSNKLTDIMYEYGSACRGDWNDIDGRTILGAMETFASYVEAGNATLTNEEAKALRINLGLCLNGCGCWEDECKAYGCGLEE